MDATRHALRWAIVAACVMVQPYRTHAQDIYRWTDEKGNIYFGNSPPANAKGLEAKDRRKTDAELQCEAAARRQCDHEMEGVEASGEAATAMLRSCLERATRNCKNSAKAERTQAPAQQVFVTPRLEFDPASGDSLVCEMRCATACTGEVEIWDAERLATGENSGMKEYTVRVVPPRAGSAYCRVATVDRNAAVVFNLVRGGSVISTVRGSNGH